jgi:hypothetical protein
VWVAVKAQLVETPAPSEVPTSAVHCSDSSYVLSDNASVVTVSGEVFVIVSVYVNDPPGSGRLAGIADFDLHRRSHVVEVTVSSSSSVAGVRHHPPRWRSR